MEVCHTSFYILCKIIDFNIILDNYTLYIIAEKQSISINSNPSFVLHSRLVFLDRGGTVKIESLINLMGFLSQWEQIFHEFKL